MGKVENRLLYVYEGALSESAVAKGRGFFFGGPTKVKGKRRRVRGIRTTGVMIFSEVPAGPRRKFVLFFRQKGKFESVLGSSLGPISVPVENRGSRKIRDVSEIDVFSKTRKRGK